LLLVLLGATNARSARSHSRNSSSDGVCRRRRHRLARLGHFFFRRASSVDGWMMDWRRFIIPFSGLRTHFN
jgi:hypothetical protein